MTNYFQITEAFDDAKFKGLSDGAKLLYGRIFNLSMGEHSKKLGGSVTASNKWFADKNHWGVGKVGRKIDELKRWNLISTNYVKKEVTRTTRFITILPIADVMQPSLMNSDITEDLSIVTEAPLISAPSTTQNCTEDHSELSTIINKKTNKIKNKGNKPSLMNSEWITDWITNGWISRTTGFEELLYNLTNEEVTQLEKLIKDNVQQQNKPHINIVIEKELYKGNAYKEYKPVQPELKNWLERA